VAPTDLKHGLAAPAVGRLGRALRKADPSFPLAAFKRSATRGLGQLELKDRVRHVTAALSKHLPSDFDDAVELALAAAEHWDPGDPDDPLRGFAAWPLIDWVPEAGIAQVDTSLEALRKLTGLFTAEFAIRPFLLTETDKTLRHLRKWLRDPEPQVRRLISEGTRPRLPWAPRLPMFQRDPSPVLALLERLRDDPAEYVRRSVANNLNDISKDHPDRVVQVATRWMKGASHERSWIVKHALRSLIKQGNHGAQEALGFTTRPQVDATLQISPKSLHIGETLNIKVQLRSRARTAQRLVVDYLVHYRKANGTTAPKVFKLRVVELKPGQQLQIEAKRSLAPRSTRRLYPGEHAVELLVAGRATGRQSFRLRA
jgi:3-methyladenine DNA glycosylase AlkC